MADQANASQRTISPGASGSQNTAPTTKLSDDTNPCGSLAESLRAVGQDINIVKGTN